MQGGEIGIQEFRISYAGRKYLEGKPGGRRGLYGWPPRLLWWGGGSAEAGIEVI